MGSPPHPVTGVPRTLTIAGSDSGGGAGVQADLKVFFAFGCHGMSAFTALTAQNTLGVNAIHEVPPGFVEAQIAAVAEDIGIDAAKTGMLASAPIVEAVAGSVKAHGITRLVVDPVFVSKSGHRLLAADAVEALIDRLFPLAALITPNLEEAGALLGAPITSLEDMKAAARSLYAMGPHSVVVKGGHLEGATAVDVFYDGGEVVELASRRWATDDTHGTGDTLAAAVTARLAWGDDLLSALTAGKEFVSGAIEHSLRLGGGFGPVNPGWRLLRPSGEGT